MNEISPRNTSQLARNVSETTDVPHITFVRRSVFHRRPGRAHRPRARYIVEALRRRQLAPKAHGINDWKLSLIPLKRELDELKA